ncbi:2-amino-4-hydroxy-6-hydroxymethyldihydropteridine diphosphokinase [Lepagella muris]|jgi:2-amino-4-hydroxy-6-hydroxymethyldihydropteridine diphosphokinase|uniref:Uncharacterized protein n=1 Tax=Lepagella muris TaxID=3032870 RepID=A0AC61RM18_9BACT|nr:2-amino-4-hydroxy-6-hydroxymethyldihydropteridine diphosphokinase [Lepagella muris]ROT06080.1 hypothetical protein EEL33_10765 [Muribaculaceae bacterium Isolate-037 (Harlan)]TGY80487.1 hypothetical protein E5331_01820 [Lepagella muris]THG53385.1 hypothetical protein E5984_02555 [Bacteroidales bacterium]TKC61620.1 hypothetical protein E5359_006600 [Bacteroidales bacterium]
MHTQDISVVLSLGSNCGDRERSVGEAMTWLSGILGDYMESEIYETLPVGHSGANYMNAVVSGSYPGSLSDLEMACKEYERSCGRDEESRREKRVPVDVDIVMADGEILRSRDYACSFFQQGYRQLTDNEKAGR